jgi:hypothetical protein
LLLGDFAASAQLVERAAAADANKPELLPAAWDARWGDAHELIAAAAELRSGNQANAERRLTTLGALLDRMLHDGEQRWGIYELRADILALLNRNDAAMQALTRAADLGWSRASSAQREPYFSALAAREDFRTLIRRVMQKNAMLRSNLGRGG